MALQKPRLYPCVRSQWKLGCFGKIAIQDIAEPHAGRSRVLYILGLITEAIAPFCAVIILQHFIPLTQQVRDYAIVGSLIWALITFAGFFDPKFSEKVSTINELYPFKQ